MGIVAKIEHKCLLLIVVVVVAGEISGKVCRHLRYSLCSRHARVVFVGRRLVFGWGVGTPFPILGGR